MMNKSSENRRTDSPSGWQARLSAPARRALGHAGITTPEELARYREKDLLKLHGLGPASLPVLREVLAASGLAFRP